MHSVLQFCTWICENLWLFCPFFVSSPPDRLTTQMIYPLACSPIAYLPLACSPLISLPHWMISPFSLLHQLFSCADRNCSLRSAYIPVAYLYGWHVFFSYSWWLKNAGNCCMIDWRIHKSRIIQRFFNTTSTNSHSHEHILAENLLSFGCLGLGPWFILHPTGHIGPHSTPSVSVKSCHLCFFPGEHHLW